MLRELVGDEMTVNTPAVRPLCSLVQGEDQNLSRIMTPAKAIAEGANRIVVGRPVLQAADPYDMVLRIKDEIAQALAA
jgi:orotidine-5'-phosphate decarboxylase